MIAAIPQFRALPVNHGINLAPRACQRVAKKQLTIPKSPMLRTKARSRASSAARGGAENVRP
jgi:hypothetical protein